MNVSKSTQIKSVQLLLVFLSLLFPQRVLDLRTHIKRQRAGSAFLMRKKTPQALPSPQANGSEDLIWSGHKRFPARVKV